MFRAAQVLLARRLPHLSVSVCPQRMLSTYSQPPPSPSSPKRVLTGYRFRKPEGVLEVSFRPAKFRPVGAKGIYHSMTTEGSVRLTLCASTGPPLGASSGPGPSYPEYDYANKIHVDVTALDIVTIVQSPISQPVRYLFFSFCFVLLVIVAKHFLECFLSLYYYYYWLISLSTFILFPPSFTTKDHGCVLGCEWSRRQASS